jgi:hypothetical protein
MNYKNIVEKMAIKLGLVDFKFEDFAAIEITLEDGTIVYTMDKLDIGSIVTSDMELTIPLNDGDYTVNDGTIFTILDGVVSTMIVDTTEVEAPEVEVEIEQKEEVIEKVEEVIEEKKYAESELVDGVKIYYDTLEVGQPIYTEETMENVVPDGEYTTILGEIITVVDGKVSDIKSVVEENQELKKLIKENELELSDLKKELSELSAKNIELNKTILKQKEDFSKLPANISLKFGDVENNNVNVLEEKRANRSAFRQALKNK